MRFTEQAKKILLVLSRNPGQMTVRTMALEIEGGSALYGGRYLETARRVSYGRTLHRLVSEGYVERRAGGREHAYSLTPKGWEKAREITIRIREYIERWTPYIESHQQPVRRG